MPRPRYSLVAALLAASLAHAQVTATWDGTTGNWNDPIRWSTNPLFPNNGNGGQNYNAIVNTGSVTVNQNITVQGLTIGQGTEFQSVAINTASGFALTVNGPLTWTGGLISGGTLGGQGTTTLNGVGTASGTSTKNLNGVLAVGSGGSLTLTTGAIRSSAAGAGINVLAGGTFDIQTGPTIITVLNGSSQPGTLTNAGIVRRTAGTADAHISWQMVNSGTFEVQTGVVSFSTGNGNGAGSVTNTGTLTMADGARIGSGNGGGIITNNAGGLMRGPAGGTGTYGGGGFGRQFVFNSGSTLAAGGTESAGRLILFGDLTMNSGATFHQSLNGTTVTTGFDRVEVSGAVDLGGSTLAGDVTGFNPTPADRYFILLNDLDDPITGTFAGLPQNGTGTFGQYQFQISYQGDSLSNSLTGGNDLVLYNFTPVPEPAGLLAGTAVVSGAGLGWRAWCRRTAAA